jgi:CBS-domain-containing membrane protein
MLQPTEPLVSDVLEGKDPRIISTKTNILATQAANLMATERVGIIIVVDDTGKFCGILSERDIVRAFGRLGAKAAFATCRWSKTAASRASSASAIFSAFWPAP